MPTSKKVQKLSEEILNDKDSVVLIDEFLEQTNIWHSLCRKGLFSMNFIAEEKEFDKKSEYYVYEKLTFIFLLYYKHEEETLLATHNKFLQSIPLYEKMTAKYYLNTDKEIDFSKLNVCIKSIFNTISKNRENFFNVEEFYKNFFLAKELGESLSTNPLNPQKIKI